MLFSYIWIIKHDILFSNKTYNDKYSSITTKFYDQISLLYILKKCGFYYLLIALLIVLCSWKTWEKIITYVSWIFIALTSIDSR